MLIWNITTQTMTGTIIPIPTITRSLGMEIIPTGEPENCIKHISVKTDMLIWNITTQTMTGTIIPIPTITRSLGMEIIPTGERT